MFKPAPQTLLPHDELRRLEEMKQIVARATSDMMMTPDWGLTMQLVDLTNGTRDARVLTELVEMLRKRLAAKSLGHIPVTLDLVEALVKNGGLPVQTALPRGLTATQDTRFS